MYLGKDGYTEDLVIQRFVISRFHCNHHHNHHHYHHHRRHHHCQLAVIQATARTVGQRSPWRLVNIFSLSPFEAFICFFFLQSLCFFSNFFDNRPAITFDLAAWRLSLQQGSSSLLCLRLSLAAILVLLNTISEESRCMALQQLV